MVIRRDPHLLGYRRSRWRLEMVAEACDWLRVTTAGGLSRLLKRLGISLKRGREYVHSPDRHYLESRARSLVLDADDAPDWRRLQALAQVLAEMDCRANRSVLPGRDE